MKYLTFIRGEKRIQYSGEADYPDLPSTVTSYNLPPPKNEELISDFFQLDKPVIYLRPPDNGEHCSDYCYAIYKVLVEEDADSGNEDVSKMCVVGAFFPRYYSEFMFPKKSWYAFDCALNQRYWSYTEWNADIYQCFLRAVTLYNCELSTFTRHWVSRSTALHTDLVKIGSHPQRIFNRCMDELDLLMRDAKINHLGDYFGLLTVLLEYFQTIHGAKSIDDVSKSRLALLQEKQLMIYSVEVMKLQVPRIFFGLFYDPKKLAALNEIIHSIMKTYDSDHLKSIFNKLQGSQNNGNRMTLQRQ